MGLSLLLRRRAGREVRTGWLGAGRRINPGLTRCIKNGAKPAFEEKGRERNEDRLVGKAGE